MTVSGNSRDNLIFAALRHREIVGAFESSRQLNPDGTKRHDPKLFNDLAIETSNLLSALTQYVLEKP